MRAVQAGPVTGLIAQVLLLAALAATVGLGARRLGRRSRLRRDHGRGAGARPLRYRSRPAGPGRLGDPCSGDARRRRRGADRGLVRPSRAGRDAGGARGRRARAGRVDGWVARRTGTASTLGARFDGEVDAFLILVLSVYVAPSAGAWVLAIGAARYAFLAAGWLLPWMRAPLPPRYWRKVVAATQGIVLTIAAADVLPLALTQAALVAALALLAESFGRDVWWLWRHRHAAGTAAVGRRSRAADTAPDGRVRPASPPCSRSSPSCSCGSPSSLRTSRAVSRPARS